MNNNYEDMSALEALKLIKNKKMLLPDIQREYVWEESDIESLFESIVQGYPVGACIFWKTNKNRLNETKPNLYYFLEKCKKDRGQVPQNEKAPESIAEEGDYYLVLDGQQRLTSMNLALFGSYTTLPKWKKAKHAYNWVTRELYYNLDYRDIDPIELDQDAKMFKFLSSDEAAQGHYFKVKKIVEFNNAQGCMRGLMELGIKGNALDDLYVLYTRLNDSTSQGLVHYYCIKEDNYDIALDIFVRVNSTGKKLSKTDLLFSTLINGWQTGKDEIVNLLDAVNKMGDGYEFSRDYLMRLCLVLENCDTNLRIENLNKKTVDQIRNDWDKIKDTLIKTVECLMEIGISGDYLISYNATMPLAYYIFNGGSFESKVSKEGAKKFLAVSFAKGLFGVASNSALATSRNAIKEINCAKNDFNLEIFKDYILTGARTFTVSREEITNWVDRFEKGQNTFVFLTLLYPNLKLGQIAFHQDHVHPFVGFENRNIKKLGLDEETILRWQRIRNTLPNLQFLEGSENESKNGESLIQWIEEGNDFAFHPDNISLELKDFEIFYEKRREMILEELFKIFNV